MLADDCPFNELLREVRAGNGDAAVLLVKRYESAIRVAVRIRLSDPGLRRQFDSMDICQSVLASFFLRAATGQFDLHDPAQLVALLTSMARNKLAMQTRRHLRSRRDVRRVVSLDESKSDPASRDPQPTQVAMGRELLDRAYAIMDNSVRDIALRRALGDEWAEIAAQLGGTAEAKRKQYRRAIDRIAAQLEIE